MCVAQYALKLLFFEICTLSSRYIRTYDSFSSVILLYMSDAIWYHIHNEYTICQIPYHSVFYWLNHLLCVFFSDWEVVSFDHKYLYNNSYDQMTLFLEYIIISRCFYNICFWNICFDSFFIICSYNTKSYETTRTRVDILVSVEQINMYPPKHSIGNKQVLIRSNSPKYMRLITLHLRMYNIRVWNHIVNRCKWIITNLKIPSPDTGPNINQTNPLLNTLWPLQWKYYISHRYPNTYM